MRLMVNDHDHNADDDNDSGPYGHDIVHLDWNDDGHDDGEDDDTYVHVFFIYLLCPGLLH